MSLLIQRAEFFIADYEKRFAWYVDQAGAEVAQRFQVSLDISMLKLSRQPDAGRVRHFSHPKLLDLRSYRVERPFDRC